MWRKTAHPTVESRRIDNCVLNMALPAGDPPKESLRRRKSLNLKDPKRSGMRIAEVVGGKTAECAAILCCCPCGLANLFILAAVRLPAGLCRQALRKRILRSKNRAELSGSGFCHERSRSGSSKTGSPIDDDFADFDDKLGGAMMVYGDRWPARTPAADIMELEKEMLAKFYSSGFWRSLSQKDAH